MLPWKLAEFEACSARQAVKAAFSPPAPTPSPFSSSAPSRCPFEPGSSPNSTSRPQVPGEITGLLVGAGNNHPREPTSYVRGHTPLRLLRWPLLLLAGFFLRGPSQGSLAPSLPNSPPIPPCLLASLPSYFFALLPPRTRSVSVRRGPVLVGSLPSGSVTAEGDGVREGQAVRDGRCQTQRDTDRMSDSGST